MLRSDLIISIEIIKGVKITHVLFYRKKIHTHTHAFNGYFIY